MRSVCAVLILTLFAGAAAGQKHKGSAHSRARTTAKAPAANNQPRLVGSPISIVTKNGDRIAGTLVDITAYSVKLKANNLESTIALDGIASLAFGDSPVEKPRQVSSAAPVSADFARSAEPVVTQFQNLAKQLAQGTEYGDYGERLAKLRRSAEQFIGRYGASDSPSEARVVAILSAALTDYSWAKTIWQLRFNRSGDTTAFDTDTPALSDALALYPDLREASAVDKKYSVDKVVSGLWRKAADKTDRAKTLAAGGH